MRKLIAAFTVLSTLFSSGAFAHELEDDVYYTEEDDDLFNHGKFIGQENNEYQKRIRKERVKNWTIALTTTAIGVATVVLVGKNHTPQ